MRRTEETRAVDHGFEKRKMLLLFHGIEIKTERCDLEIAPVDHSIQLLCQLFQKTGIEGFHMKIDRAGLIARVDRGVQRLLRHPAGQTGPDFDDLLHMTFPPNHGIIQILRSHVSRQTV